jgi:hypothetical protein
VKCVHCELAKQTERVQNSGKFDRVRVADKSHRAAREGKVRIEFSAHMCVHIEAAAGGDFDRHGCAPQQTAAALQRPAHCLSHNAGDADIVQTELYVACWSTRCEQVWVPRLCLAFGSATKNRTSAGSCLALYTNVRLEQAGLRYT